MALPFDMPSALVGDLPSLIYMAVGFLLLVIVLMQASRIRQWRAAAAAHRKKEEGLQAELQRLKSAPRTQEFRVGNYDVLWFPVVSYKETIKSVLDVKAGAPHCSACVVPLKPPADSGEWACPQCGKKSPPTVVDVVCMDQVCKQAADFFLQRHPGYALPGKPA